MNRSNDQAVLVLQGPSSRNLLAACTDAALDNANFKWLSAQEIEVASHHKRHNLGICDRRDARMVVDIGRLM